MGGPERNDLRLRALEAAARAERVEPGNDLARAPLGMVPGARIAIVKLLTTLGAGQQAAGVLMEYDGDSGTCVETGLPAVILFDALGSLNLAAERCVYAWQDPTAAHIFYPFFTC